MEQNKCNCKNVEFLKKIYKNSKTGTEAISYLKDKIEDKNLLEDIMTQNGEYEEIKAHAETELSKLGEVPKEECPVSKITMWTGVELNTMISKNPDKIAEMMMQGSTRGVIDMARTLKEYDCVDEKYLKLGEELIALEERSFERMKKFLG